MKYLIALAVGLFSTSPLTGYSQVIINEFMASNDTILVDEDGDNEDWIELYNAGGSAVNLTGWYLTDDSDDLTQWTLPSVTLNSESYLIVFASDKDRTDPNSELHSNFKLSSGGEYLALVSSDGSTVISEFTPEYPEQFDDWSYGHAGYYVSPTPGGQNNQAVIGFGEPVEFSLAHGFYTSPQTLALSSSSSNATIRYTLDGSPPPTGTGCIAPENGKAWSYKYYAGPFTVMPNFDNLLHSSTGTVDEISTDIGQPTSNSGLEFIGCVQALEAGYYTFETTSNEGSQLFVGGQLLVDNTGSGLTTLDADVYLDKGLHEVKLAYYQGTSDAQLSAQWIAPGRSNSAVLTHDSGVLYAADPNSTQSINFEFEVPSDGDFTIDATVLGPNSNSDSFWVQLDDGAFWQFDLGVSTDFQTIQLNNLGSELTHSLDHGEHTLKFYPREDGALIDSISISGTCVGPCETQNFEAETQSISNFFVQIGSVAEPLHSEKWFTYNAPFVINETSVVRATAVESNYLAPKTVTQSYFFVDDIIEQSPNEETPDGWNESDANGKINDQVLNYGMDPDIIDPDPNAVKTSLQSLPTVSIVTDIDNLLHPETGIYVNAQEKGRNWERPASIEIIEDSNSVTIDAGIRIRGGYSRNANNTKHPFRLYFRDEYGGDLEYPLFDNEQFGRESADEFERIDFRSPNNYSWAFDSNTGHRNTLLREIWARDTQAALGLPYTRSRYYHLYINGQYWGIHMTQERVTKAFGKSYFGGKKGDYDVVKHNRQDNYRFEASEGNTEAWIDIWDMVADQTIDASEYQTLDQLVDFENLIDYMIVNGYEGDLDGATSWFLRTSDNSTRWARANNWYAMRDREDDTLKWSFFQHDGEHTMDARRTTDSINTLITRAPFDGSANNYFQRDYMNPAWLHAALITNIEYRQRAIDRIAELFADSGALSTTQALARWNAREGQVSAAILAHSARWGDAKTSAPRTVADWQAEVDYVEDTFFVDRSEIVFQQLVDLGLAFEDLFELSIPSGTTVTAGTVVDVTNNSTGDVYYSTDGTDPRAEGGNTSASASVVTNGTIVINQTTTLWFRVKFADGSWGPLTKVTYLVDAETCYVIPTANGKTVVFCL